jgi:hypothetical protein
LTVNGGCDTRIEAVVGGANAWNCKSINWPLNAKKNENDGNGGFG